MKKNQIKNQMIFLLCGIVYSFSFSQHRIDENWLVGYAYNHLPPYGLNKIDFKDSFSISYVDNLPISYSRTSVTITSEQTGDMLFTSNGFIVLGKDRDTMENGAGLSPCYYQELDAEYGSAISQGTIVLPYPGSSSKYVLFHGPAVYQAPGYYSRLHMSVLDMNLNNGNGKVISKNQTLIVDNLYLGSLTATRHANGRDWWIIAPRWSSDSYYQLLLTPDGISQLDSQHVDTTVIIDYGAALFSPDGSKYLKYDPPVDRLVLMDFDRCTGRFSNLQEMFFPVVGPGGGAVFSPNGRWLYVCTDTIMYQLDMYAADISASRVVLDTWDGYASPFGSGFGAGQLAPDGKIYFNCPNGENVMHVIHHPDSAGLACGFEQHGIQLLSYNAFTMPHYPNYYLGALPGSGCDTLATALSPPASIASVYLYPNPACERIFVGTNHLSPPFFVEIINHLGQAVYQQVITQSQSETEISTRNLPRGVYYLRLRDKGGKEVAEKFMRE
jgi:hypothetical protein